MEVRYAPNIMRTVEMIRLIVNGSFKNNIPQAMLTIGIKRIKFAMTFMPIFFTARFQK